MGIGNSLNGDDGAGPWAAVRLQAALGKRANLLVLDCGPAPEAYSGVVRRFSPQKVLFIDAAEMGLPAGSLQLIEWERLENAAPGTHALAISLLASFLQGSLDCQVALLGIQPACLDFDSGISKEVRRALRALVRSLVAGFTPVSNADELKYSR